jgi:hypothetical protein
MIAPIDDVWAVTYHAHGLAHDVDHGLVGYGARVCEEEKGQGYVEKGERGEDRLG